MKVKRSEGRREMRGRGKSMGGLLFFLKKKKSIMLTRGANSNISIFVIRSIMERWKWFIRLYKIGSKGEGEFS